MSQGGENLHGGYPQFQGLIDDVLGKDDPAACIPWSASSRPAWAGGFTPASVLDLGVATGRFTASVLTCLGDWGCLTDLRRLHLVEEEPGFDGSDEPMVEESIVDRCRTALASVPIEILLSNETVGLTPSEESGDIEITIGTEKAEAADLIIASHFTYYFPDGGRSLLKALASTLRRSGGLGWIVVRRRDCPIYRQREQHVATLAADCDTTDIYAEDVEEWIRASESGLELVEGKDHAFLAGPVHPASHVDVASLLMWRRPLNALTRAERGALEQAFCALGPLFVERHLIVKCAD